METEQDRTFAIQIREGNQLAFAALYDRYHKQLYALAFRYLKNREMAEDALQDVFVNFWLKRNLIKEELNIRSLLFTSLKNRILNIIRDNQKTILRSYEILADNQYADDEQDNLDQEIEMAGLIEEAVENLSPQKRLIFCLKNEKKLTNEQISTQLNISINTVKSQYYNILKEIRVHLSQHLTSYSTLLYFLFKL